MYRIILSLQICVDYGSLDSFLREFPLGMSVLAVYGNYLRNISPPPRVSSISRVPTLAADLSDPQFIFRDAAGRDLCKSIRKNVRRTIKDE